MSTIINLENEAGEVFEYTLAQAQFIYRKLDEVFSTHSGAQRLEDQRKLDFQSEFSSSVDKSISKALGLGEQ